MSASAKNTKKDPAQVPGRVPVQTSSEISYQYEEPSMTIALFVYWVIPVLIFALVSRYTVDTSVPTIPIDTSPRPVQIPRKRPATSTAVPGAPPSPEPSAAPSWPTAYREVVETISKRRRRIQVDSSPTTGASSSSSSKQTESSATTTSTTAPASRTRNDDPIRQQLHEKIAQLKQQHEQNPDNLLDALAYADAMRYYDLNYHDGGSYEQEAIAMYDKLVEMALRQKEKLVQQGKATNESSTGMRDVAAEVTMDYASRSADGVLCGIYTSQGKTYFMANWFKSAAESYSKCLEIEPNYLDAVNARGSSYIILGRYEEAGADLLKVLRQDNNLMFSDAFQGLARVLQTKEDAISEGWSALVDIAKPAISSLEARLQASPPGKQFLASTLNKLYHALFLYHDTKTKNYAEAFQHLTQSYKHKMSFLNPWQKGSELAKVAQSKSIFQAGFWPPDVGSQTRIPIFIVGFVRSGSTLLERVLDAHPMIVGTGENSVFNGRLPDIRNEIVQASVTDPDSIGDVTRRLADDVVEGMKHRWEILETHTSNTEKDVEPQRFVDKMLTNYYNIGFIQMLYPNALILHVVREPMDTVFSAYKHEFPPGTLDYTSDFESLAELYAAYRDIMEHWDEVLPGRVTHIRYEDLVNDMPGMARAIIEATGLQWDDGVLEFHRKKHAVNTLSTTQVRKGIYKDSLKAWMRYEDQLKPLVEKLGDLASYELKTNLPGYKPPVAEEATE